MASSWLDLLHSYPHGGQLFVEILLSSAALTQLALLLAYRRRLLPDVRQRDVHTVPKPRVGGVAMWLTVLLAFIYVGSLPEGRALLDFNRAHYGGVDISLWGILAGMLVLLVMGLVDDIRGLPWSGQLLGQLLATLMLVAAGIRVPFIRLPSGQELQFGPLAGNLFTIVWVMAIINVMNWFDGLDGLAGSVAVIAGAILFLVSVKVGFLATASLSLIVSAAALGFLPWNWYPSRLFMGTVGSQLLGFLLGVIAIISGGKVATAVLVLGIPLLDAAIVICRRLAAGQSPFLADQRHLHHRLLKVGLPVPWVVLLIDLVALLFGGLALSVSGSSGKSLLSLALIGCMALFIAATYALERRAAKGVD